MPKLNKSFYSDEEIANEGEGTEPKPVAEAKPKIKSVRMVEGEQAGENETPMQGDMPEQPEAEDMSIGKIFISSKDNPKVGNWKLDKEYPMRVRMVGSRLDEEKNVVGEFEIVRA